MTKQQMEELALELFAGRIVRTKRGKLKLEYPSGPREEEARLALAKVLGYWNPEEVNVSLVMTGLITALLAPVADWDQSRQLVFKSPRRGRPSTSSRADAIIDRYVTAKEQECGKTEAAIEYAMKEFGLRRKAIFDARRRQRESERKFEASLQESLKTARRARVSFNQD